jgi:hypothetical protein
MQDLDRSAGYNSRNPEMLPSLRAHWACVFLFLLVASGFATDWHQSETQVAQQIAAITGPGVIALNVSNRSSIGSADVEEISRGIVSILAVSGIRVWEPERAAATVQLTLSQNLQDYIWVAEIKQGTGEPVIAIVSSPRPDLSPGTQSSSLISLRATHLISSSDPILDFAIVESNPRMLLAFSTGRVRTYQFKDGRWLEAQSIPLTSPTALPRDARGRILLRQDHLFDAYLPGMFCRSTTGTPLSGSCGRSDDPWPLETEANSLSGFFAPTRNFFTGALVPGIGGQKSAPLFYSAAAIGRDKYTLWLFAGVDGQLHMLDGIRQQTAGKVHWGDIAGIHTGCGRGWQVLASSQEAASEDSIQAFELPDREPVAVSQKLALNGTVTALWTAQDGQSAAAVYHDSETGSYEAVLLNLVCGQ